MIVVPIIFVPIAQYGTTIKAGGLRPSVRVRAVRMVAVPAWRAA